MRACRTVKKAHGGWTFVRADVADGDALKRLFAEHRFDRVIHLAAQAGVRYSLSHPEAYVQSNLVGFTNILEACRHNDVAHLTYASTSSVYGGNTSMPFSEHRGADHPLQFYAATKRANELMAHAYSHLFGLPTTGLRFFTVYGPWGRPDMAFFTFTKAILEGKPIKLFNHGHHSRDFTYVDDIVGGRGARFRSGRRPKSYSGQAMPPIQPHRMRRSASTTLATANRCHSLIMLRPSRKQPAAKPSASIFPCSRVMFPIHGPMSLTLSGRSAIAREPQSGRAWPGS